MVQVLGLEGSPRENGNTEKLVRAVLAGAQDSGAETRFYKLARMTIAPCQGCIGCRTDGTCIIEDDMTELYSAVQASRAVVIGSPVYMWQMTAQTKAFVDRLVPFIQPDFSTRLAGPKKMLLAFTQGNPNPDAFRIYFDYLQKLFAFLSFEVTGTLVAPGTRDAEDILQQTAVMDRAREMGHGLAQ